MLPLLVKEMRAAMENLNRLIEHAQGWSRACNSAAACGEGTRRRCATGPQETIQSTSRSFMIRQVSMVAGFKATTGLIKTHIHREEEAINGK